MKITIATLLATLSIGVLADEYISPITGKAVPKDGPYTVEQIKARDERVLKKTGGFLLQKAAGPEAMVIDSRAKATLTIDEVARVYKLGCKLNMNTEKTVRGNEAPLKFAQKKMAEKKPLMLVVVIEGADEWPALSVFPEERIGLVNADKLKGGDDPSAPETRVSKEIWRALGFVGGIGFSHMENDMMQPYYTLEEIDGNMHNYIQPMNMAKWGALWKRFGVKKEMKVPYRVACQQGWAPAPTNEYQKAVWDEVRAAPKNPMKIKFDPKKGR